ncbi:MAG: ImmA/IrrE family metallo-endopeptidase [Acidimicrobiia bacterium]
MSRGIIASLRDMVPIRPLTRIEALSVTERQALRLLELTGVNAPPVPERVAGELPRVQVIRSARIGHSGASAWEQGRWRIVLNANDSRLRQRFSLFHELKHILDHPFARQLYGAVDGHERDDWIELVCDYFAGCVLMPRPWLKSAWTGGNQRLSTLARQFDVSQAAMHTRLHQTGLAVQERRCGRHGSGRRGATYFRRGSVTAEAVAALAVTSHLISPTKAHRTVSK